MKINSWSELMFVLAICFLVGFFFGIVGAWVMLILEYGRIPG